MNAILPVLPDYANRFSTSALVAPRRQATISLHRLFEFGNRLHKAGRLTDAETIFRKILDHRPDHPMALLSLGILAHQSNRHDAAINLIERVIDLAPHYPQAHNNLGVVHSSLGDYPRAIEAHTRAVALNPNYADAYFNLGVAHRLNADQKAALDAFEKCRRISSNRADVYFEIGQCSIKLNDRVQAQIALRTAIAIDPKHVAAHNALGQMLNAMAHHDDAKIEFEAVLAENENDVRALNGLSEGFKRQGHFDESLEVLEKAYAVNPNDIETLGNLASTYQSIGDNDQAAHYYGRVLEIAPGADCAEKSSLFVALNYPSMPSDALFKLHRDLRGRHDRANDAAAKFKDRSRDPNKKLRIGYVSSDFRTHVVALNVSPLIGNHDRKQIEIFLYSQEKSTDHMTKAFKDFSDRYTPINHLSDEEAADLIAEDEIDILVLLAGRFDENRPIIAAHRAAPVQVSFHDCATSGLADMDYWLTDSVLHPTDTPEQFTEQLYRLPVYYQYPVQDGLPQVAPSPVFENGFVTFGSFNKPEKINDEVISLWSDVLHAVPNSKLFLKYFNHYSEESMQRRWLEKFAANGIGEDRLILKAQSDSRSKHLLLYGDIDIALDPFPFNGATTTFESLSMGVPVVALLGRHFVDRVAASMLHHTGLHELIAKDREDYVEIARRLAGDLTELKNLRGSIRDRLHASPLCDGTTYAQSVEAAFRDMWTTWCETGGYRGR